MFVDIKQGRRDKSAQRYYYFNDAGRQRYEEIKAQRNALDDERN